MSYDLCLLRQAEKPYYIESIRTAIYSLEELCFYMYNNVCLIDDTIINEKLCDWIRDELHLGKLYRQLYEQLEKKDGAAFFVLPIFREAGYLTNQEMREFQEKLAKLQRKLARQKKGSRNSRKTKHKIARLHRYIADSRRDFLHKTSTKIAKNHSIVYVEDLKVSNMSASASGTKESPGKNVKQKSRLNRSILDQGWYGFFQMLSYKLEQRGGKLIKVDPKSTSRTCPRCGLVSAENRKSQATFACIGCGYRSNADEVGAINVLRSGRAQLACAMSGAVRPLSAGTRRDPLQH